MKKLMKFLIATLMICIVASSSYAFSKSKQPKLDKTSITIQEGKSIKLKIKNSNKLKFTWTSTNKKVCTVDSKGKVKGKKSGYAYITAKNKKKRITLVASVKVEINKDKIKDKIDYEYDNNNEMIVARITNNNSVNVTIDFKMAFFDSAGMLIDNTSEYMHIESGETACAILRFPYDSNFKTIIPATYSESIDVIRVDDDNHASNIVTKYNYSDAGIAVSALNTSSYTLRTIKITCLSYDSNKRLIDADYGYMDCYESNKEGYKTFSYPYDSNYKEIRPSYSEIYVDYAY